MKTLKCLLYAGLLVAGHNSYSQGSFWNILGNSGTVPGTNFVGTTDNNRLVFKTANAERATILTNGNVGIGTNNPQVRLAINGVGQNIYATDVWTENNLHVQGNEGLVVGGRGRLRVGTAWNHVGLYAEASSSGANNDLILGASSGTVRVGPNPASSVQNLFVSGRVFANNTSNVFERTTKVNGIWPNETFDGLNGVHIYNAEAEQGGYFANGNYSAIYGPGDNDLVKFLDEDWFNGTGFIHDNNAVKARIDGVGNYWVVSDRKQKTDITPIDNGLDRVLQLTGYTFSYLQNQEEIEKGAPVFRSAGIIAQELSNVLPEAVSVDDPAADAGYMVNYAAMSSLFVEAIKGLNDKIRRLEERLDACGCGALAKAAPAVGPDKAAGVDMLQQSIPNPADNMVTINYSLRKGYQQASIIIYSQEGKPAKTVTLNTSGGEGSIKVNLASFKSGSYTYTLTADGKALGTKKLIVIK